MKDKLDNLLKLVNNELDKIDSLIDYESLRVKYLGKKSEIVNELKNLRNYSSDERASIGKIVNETRVNMENLFSKKMEELKKKEMDRKLRDEVIDITLSGKKVKIGSKNPIQLFLNEIQDIFLNMGFIIGEGPDIEKEYYNFEALNISKDHPARSEQDTFYIDENYVLRTHTSPVQIRIMENNKPPIKMISPGRVYRSDAIDATHSPIFYQMEGLVIDKGVNMSHLKGTLETFVRAMFGSKMETKFRAHHFPFTEPSAEMDATCFLCKGSGCSICKGLGYIEILGCGMVHPDVLRRSGIDPDIYSGFAFGFGIDRMVMLKYGIEDIRLLYESDLRFLSQFK